MTTAEPTTDPATEDPSTNPTETPPEASTAPPEPDPTEAADDDAKGDDKIGREAARYRTRLRAAEAANAALATEYAEAVAALETAHAATQDTLTRQREAIVNLSFDRAGLDPRLANAAGITVESVLTEDGLLDGAKLGAAITAAVKDFGVQPRGKPRPNRQQGQPSEGSPGGASWSSVLNDAGRGGRRSR